MTRQSHAHLQVENRLDRERESEFSRERRERASAVLSETARSIVNAAFDHRSPEEREALAWLVIDLIVDRLIGWIDPALVVSKLGALAKRAGHFINLPKPSREKAEALFKEPA